MPLADEIRPKSLNEVVGQEHLLAPKAPFRRIIESGSLPNLIFYGPPGTGKTTVADIISKNASKFFKKLNATVASLSDVKDVLSSTGTLMGGGGIVLYIDEIQYFNKKQQQSLLEYIEDGRITLICSTTENPYFCVYNALLSRSSVFEFKPVSPVEIKKSLSRALDYLNRRNETSKTASEDVYDIISSSCGGDVRKSLGVLENVYYASDNILETDTAVSLVSGAGLTFDRDGDAHYDLLSAFQKSIRGSDPDAAVQYLARLLGGGDLLSVCRRLLVIANEDIGLAYSMAAVVTKSCVDSALQLGLPEATIPLSHAVILLATSPKSNSACSAYASAAADVSVGEVPSHLKDTHYAGAASLGRGGYKYPFDYPNSYVEQSYLPDALTSKKYYIPGSNKNEVASAEYWKKIRGK